MSKQTDQQVAAIDTGEASPKAKESRSSSGLISLVEDYPQASPQHTQRRSIFDTFWQRTSSSNSWKEKRMEGDDDESSASEARNEVKWAPKLESGHLGLPLFSPASSSKSLTQSPKQLPKSILRRQHCIRVLFEPEQSISTADFAIATPPLSSFDDTSDESMSQTDSESRKPSQATVQFDPTITTREVTYENFVEDSNWFSKSELQSFERETVNLCDASIRHGRMTYSRPALTEAIAAAHKAGVDAPVMSQTRKNECRSIIFYPILHASDDDAVVHDCSDDFFMIISNEVKRILIVDNSITTLKLFKRYLLSMFPEAQVEFALSGEDALRLIDVRRDSAKVPYFDIIIVEQNLQSCVPRGRILNDQNETSTLSEGSEVLRIINFVERNNPDRRRRSSLKIGVSCNLAGDCEALLRSGVDLFWCKPPPKQTKNLRNQILNHLLSKRGKNIFICEC